MGAGSSEECGNGDGGDLANAAIADLHEKECKKEVKQRRSRRRRSFLLLLLLPSVSLSLYSVCV